jgi:hypothetical protein
VFIAFLPPFFIQKESRQMKQEVYKTIVQPKEETKKYLTGWKRPSHAYILFETKEWHLSHDGERRLGTGLMTLNAESRPEINHHIDKYLQKGFRVLDYGNFPKLNDRVAARAAKAHHYSQGAGMNPWDSLEKFVQQKMASEIGWDEQKNNYEAEINILRKKLEEEKAKLSIKQSITKKSEE